jgi:hypothetical protein
MRTPLNFSVSSTVSGSFCARMRPGAIMKRVSQPRSRRAATFFRSGPTSVPCPMVWQVEQAFRNSASPGVLLSRRFSALA